MHNDTHRGSLAEFLGSSSPLMDAELEREYRDIAADSPDQGEALRRLARLLLGRGQGQAALLILERMSTLDPDDAEAAVLLAEALHQAGRSAEALEMCRKAKAARSAGQPQASESINAELLTASAWMLMDEGRTGEAESLFRRALALEPGLLAAEVGLASILYASQRYDEAETHFAQAAALSPSSPEPLIGLSATHAAMGRCEEAVENGSAAVSLAPRSIEAKLARCMAHLRIIYERPEQIEESRKAYMADLTKLEESFRPGDPGEIKAAAGTLGGLKPFFLAYQGLCDTEPQRVYGGFAAKVAAAAWPEHTRPVEPPAVGGPLRIGIASAYFHEHSNWKMPIRGWIEHLDPERFQVFCYHLGDVSDHNTERARSLSRRFVSGPRTVEELAPLIKRDRLHALIYPEIGMHPLAFRLATLRLAAVQCASWGHPETSGLPTIDYFLSSDLMEPVGAEAHYTEQLVRLPNLSIHYLPPEVPQAAPDRGAFGLPASSVLFLCAQSLFKYLPQYDDVFPKIAREVPDCRFVFIASQGSPRITELFAARLRRAFERHGLDPDRHLAVVGRLSLASYHALNRCCDVFLDSIGWSGCNSTMEALAGGLPVVTLPCGLMRGRHSLAILAMMGEMRTVAGTVEEYVGMAVRLGRDKAWREELRARIEASRSRAYADCESVRGLESFLVSASAQAVGR